MSLFVSHNRRTHRVQLDPFIAFYSRFIIRFTHSLAHSLTLYFPFQRSAFVTAKQGLTGAKIKMEIYDIIYRLSEAWFKNVYV